jgi:hypothetical protein
VARAKRTSRADARRRYRQSTAGEESAVEPSAAAAAARTPAQTATARPSVTGALRGAYRPVDLRGDIAALPTLIRHWSFWLPVVLIVGATIITVIAPSQPLAIILFQALVLPPAMAAVFIVGFFARRAAYLLGGIVATIDVLAYSAFVVAASSGAIAGIEASTSGVQGQLLSAFAVGPASGVLFGAAAAWYRRFLSLSGSGRQQRTRPKGNGRQTSGRR